MKVPKSFTGIRYAVLGSRNMDYSYEGIEIQDIADWMLDDASCDRPYI